MQTNNAVVGRTDKPCGVATQGRTAVGQSNGSHTLALMRQSFQG